jgi:hypothetical protein
MRSRLAKRLLDPVYFGSHLLLDIFLELLKFGFFLARQIIVLLLKPFQVFKKALVSFP